MNDPKQPDVPARGQFLVYQAEDGRVKVDVRLENETAWLTQAHMAELFQTTVPNISMHLRNIYAEGELRPEATLQEFLIVRREGERQVTRAVEHYNLDAIISFGTIAKNYLNEPELAALNNLVEQYLLFAEAQAMRRVPMHMRDWIAKLHAFLTVNDRNILTHAGRISHEIARELAEAEYDKFHRQQIRQADQAESDFDKAVKQLPPPPKRKRGGKK